MAKEHIQAGKNKHRFAIQSFTAAEDSLGESNKDADSNWNTDTTAWGRLVPLTGTELVEAQQMNGEINHRVEMRVGVGVAVAKRLVKGSGATARKFGVLSVIDVNERGRMLHVFCKERV